MLTIQLPNGKTAEISVRDGLYIHTPKQTYVFNEPCKGDDENVKCKTTHIVIDKYQAVQTYVSTSEKDVCHNFLDMLSRLEADCGPARIDTMGEPDIDRINDRW